MSAFYSFYFSNNRLLLSSLPKPSISIFLLVKPLENVVIEGFNARNIFGIFIGGSIGILAIITTVRMLGYLIKNAETFIMNFYNLPDTTDVK